MKKKKQSKLKQAVLAIAVGVALGSVMPEEKPITPVWTGDGYAISKEDRMRPEAAAWALMPSLWFFGYIGTATDFYGYTAGSVTIMDYAALEAAAIRVVTCTNEADFDAAIASGTLAAGDYLKITATSIAGWGNKIITTTGTAANPIVIAASDPEGKTNIITGNFRFEVDNGIDYIYIGGFKFNGSAYNPTQKNTKCILLQGSYNKVSDCHFLSCGDGTYMDSNALVKITSAANNCVSNRIEGNYFNDNLNVSVYYDLWETAPTYMPLLTELYYNTFAGTTYSGYNTVRDGVAPVSATPNSTNSIARYNHWDDCTQSGYESKAGGTVFEYNYMGGSLGHKARFYNRDGDNKCLQYNLFKNAKNGFELSGSNHVVVNNIWDAIGTGSSDAFVIEINKGGWYYTAADGCSYRGAPTNNRLENNTIINCVQNRAIGIGSPQGEAGTTSCDYLGASNGLTNVNPTGNSIRNNLVHVSGSGKSCLYFHSSTNRTQASTDWNNNFDFNLYHAESSAVALFQGSDSTSYPVTDIDLNAVEADPDEDANYVPNAGSPALNAGTTIASILDDFHGVLRDDGTPDIGACSVNSGTITPAPIKYGWINVKAMLAAKKLTPKKIRRFM